MSMIVAFGLGIVLGCGFGVLVMGVLSLESRTDEMDGYKAIIKQQGETIERQAVVIAELKEGMEDDGK